METDFIEPIARLRALAADRVKTERAELFQAFKEAISNDVNLTEMQRQELEDRIGDHNKWLAKNSPRLEALLPRTLPSIASYEMKRDLYHNQIAAVLHEAQQITINSLWGRRADGQRDPAVFPVVVSGVKNRLGQARGLAGQLHRDFLQVEVELVSLEKRGFGLPPEPVPLMNPPKPEELTRATDRYDARRPYKKQTV